jgi:hypothetical protein
VCRRQNEKVKNLHKIDCDDIYIIIRLVKQNEQASQYSGLFYMQ